MRRLIATAALSMCAWRPSKPTRTRSMVHASRWSPRRRFTASFPPTSIRVRWSLQRLLACPEGKAPPQTRQRALQGRGFGGRGNVDQGRSSGTLCAAPSGGREAFRSVTMRALSAARFTPASIDGRAVPVYASVLSLFVQKGAACHAVALLNGGIQDPAVGIDYVEPQVVRDSPDWRQRRVAVPTRYILPQLVHVARSPGTLFLRMSVAVAADGTVSDGRVDEVYRLGHVDSLNAVRALEGSRFIPGFHRACRRPCGTTKCSGSTPARPKSRRGADAICCARIQYTPHAGTRVCAGSIIRFLEALRSARRLAGDGRSVPVR